jgi:hypothetical protein
MVNGFLSPGKEPHAKLCLGVIKAAGEPVAFSIENIDYPDSLFIAFRPFDGTGKNPRMAATNRGVPVFLEEYLQHAICRFHSPGERTKVGILE